MANDHKRLQVLKAISKHLQGITVDNGYDHDISGSVFRGRTTFGDNDPIPMVSVLESPNAQYGSFADEENTVRKDTMVVLIQGFVDDDIVNPTDPAYALLADVERRLSDIVALDGPNKPKYPGAYHLRGLVSKFAMAQPVVRPPQEGLSSKAFFYLPVTVEFEMNLVQPD